MLRNNDNRLEKIEKDLKELKVAHTEKTEELRPFVSPVLYIRKYGHNTGLSRYCSDQHVSYEEAQYTLKRFEETFQEAKELDDKIKEKERKREREQTLADPIKKSAIYLNSNDKISILNHNLSKEWGDFQSVLLSATNNIDKKKYPIARLNEDNSITLLLHYCTTTGCKECNPLERFKKVLKKGFVIDQVDYHRQRLGFALTGHKKELLESKGHDETTEIAEYQLNISPIHLDTILKLNHSYASYRGVSLIALMGRVNLKSGFVQLFPAFPLENNRYLIRAAGCQFTELLSMQLLYRLPDFDGNEGKCHWIHTKVAKELSLCSSDLDYTLSRIMQDSGMFGENDGIVQLDEKGHHITRILRIPPQDQHGFTEISGPSEHQDIVRMADMDNDTSDIYSRYGSCGTQELTQCKSLEITTLAFYGYIKKTIEISLTETEYDKRDYTKEIQKIKNSIDTIDKMIEAENIKLVYPNGPGNNFV